MFTNLKIIKTLETILSCIISRVIELGLLIFSVFAIETLFVESHSLVIKITVWIWLFAVGFLAVLEGINKYQKLKIKEFEKQIENEKSKQAKIKEQIKDEQERQSKVENEK